MYIPSARILWGISRVSSCEIGKCSLEARHRWRKSRCWWKTNQILPQWSGGIRWSVFGLQDSYMLRSLLSSSFLLFPLLLLSISLPPFLLSFFLSSFPFSTSFCSLFIVFYMFIVFYKSGPWSWRLLKKTLRTSPCPMIWVPKFI